MVAQTEQAETVRKCPGDVMRLPNLPYNRTKIQRQITAFYGLNRSKSAKEGELTDSLGMSTADFPCLTQRAGREKISGYSAPSDLFEWDGKLVVIDGGMLYYDGEAIDNITDGKKQFAVVNTKLCIFPDKVYVDLSNNQFGHLDASVQTPQTGEYASFTHNSLSAELQPVLRENLSTGNLSFTKSGGVYIDQPSAYTYGSNIDSVKACWNSQSKTWSGLSALESLSAVFQPDEHTVRAIEVGDLFIPKKSRTGYVCVFASDGLPDKTLYNTSGVYGVFTDFEINAYTNNQNSDVDYVCRWYYDVYSIDSQAKLFSGEFSVGDRVSVTDTMYGLCDVEKREIIAIEDSANTLVFADGTFRAPIAAYYAASELEAGSYAFKYSSTYYKFTSTEAIASGMVLYITSVGDKVFVWDPVLKKEVAAYTAEQASSESTTYTTLRGVLYQAGYGITIERPVPDLDYICESGNRLYGVSNSDNTIYVSALGLPTRFYTYENVSTDSYAAAVGSEGDFTGICAFGGGVCCFKEGRLHKLLGNYPQEYAVYEYEIAGVQSGSERSMQIINETLYYKGVFGVYAYTGGSPALISYNLGHALYTAGVGGYDGARYYLSMLDAQGNAYLFVYDLTHKIWIKEDSIFVNAFCTADGRLFFLSGGKVYKAGAGNSEQFDWMAEFAPFDETAHVKKDYAMLRMRLDMQAGAWLKIEAAMDRGLWKQIYTQAATDAVTLNIPLRIGRCDRFSVRISGHGRVTLRSMVREFFAGSEV